MFREVPILTREERYDRASRWPVTVFRIYLAVRRSGTEKTRLETVRFASRWFHAWVWGYADLPF